MFALRFTLLFGIALIVGGVVLCNFFGTGH